VPWGRPAMPVFSSSLANLAAQDLADFDRQPPKVRRLVETSIDLTRRNLPYKFGADDPAQGGLDCSGFVHYALQQCGMRNIPRISDDLHNWVRQAGNFHPVRNTSPDSRDLDALRPGDLLFWSHTYRAKPGQRVTHVKVYLGRRKADNRPIMAGATTSRDANGGGALFEFFLNGTYHGYTAPGEFVGYGSAPGLR
jgi:peptidoglycan DL-endopeptidase CwlO